jgi:RNA polymerase sigma factor (sigma-70 family)
MRERDWLAARFEENRPHLRAVAYRMLGSLAEADDAVQEAWIRLTRSDASQIENFGGWLTTVTARVCLNMLRSRNARAEEALDPHVPDPIISREDAVDPEQEALLADAVGLALHVVLETLAPAERLAFVLHDMFAVPFDEIARILDRSPDATRQLASRGRRRVQDAAVPDVNTAGQREVVDAFFAAARHGDFDALLSVLDPNVVARADGGIARRALSAVTRGAEQVASRAISFAQPNAVVRPVLVNGAAGVVAMVDDEPVSVMGFTVRAGKIVSIDVLVDPERIRELDLSMLEDRSGPDAASGG